uniref:Uncharacterized protein n=1 Tax=Siphoviridae sp. ct2vX3 TaxID=2825318 RepID=A0A8S5PXZ4_9CAUD|nr:MAG TPA: hypothetical protein [Siphoviridae sp. ct2vX3]
MPGQFVTTCNYLPGRKSNFIPLYYITLDL